MTSNLHPVMQLALAAWMPPASNDPTGRQWVVTARTCEASHDFELRAVSSMQAFDEAQRRYPTAVRVKVRPLIELTEGEGRARYPQDLHPMASMQAFTGWMAAQQGAEARLQTFVIRDDICTGHGPTYRKALEQQQQENGWPK